jgi:2-C-methyl-D-erythritol 4-phosphate cytidylyltransferase
LKSISYERLDYFVEKGSIEAFFNVKGETSMKVGVIICAAGQGKRMGLGKNKQLLELEGKPLLIHTLQQWEVCEHISDVTVVVGQGEEEQVQGLISASRLKKKYHTIVGGKERQDSVYQGLLSLKESSTPDVVLIHDGARPFITVEEIDQLIKTVQSRDAAVLAVPMKDTIKKVAQNGQIEETLDRKQLWAIQTPQAFRFSLIWNAHQQAKEEGILATDDAALVERVGTPVYIVQGSYYNIKLTTPEDIDMAEFLLQRRRNR